MELKQIVCETCGGNLEITEKTAKCKICANVYFLKDENTTNLTTLLIRANLAIKDWDFSAATKTCEKIDIMNDELPGLWYCLLLIEAKVTSIEALFDLEKDYTNSDNFTKALYYAHTAGNQAYYDELENLKQHRMEKYITFARENDMSVARVQDKEAIMALQEKSQGNVCMYNKTEYLNCGNGFYNLNRLKFEYNKSIGSFEDYDLQDTKIIKCHEYQPNTLEIPYGVTCIGKHAFINRASQAIIIPSTVTIMEKQAFLHCKNLISIDIPNGIEIIPDGAFTECTSLESVTIPNRVTEIGMYAFAGCGKLSDIKLPNNLQKIGDAAFKDCESILTLKIPDSVVYMGKMVFYGWRAGQTIILSKKYMDKWHEDWNKENFRGAEVIQR